jgi:hypothetical protein
MDNLESCNISNRQVFASTSMEIQCDRGILYVYANDGTPLLKITGLTRPVLRGPDAHRSPRQLTIDLGRPGTSSV